MTREIVISVVSPGDAAPSVATNHACFLLLVVGVAADAVGPPAGLCRGRRLLPRSRRCHSPINCSVWAFEREIWPKNGTSGKPFMPICAYGHIGIKAYSLLSRDMLSRDLPQWKNLFA